jgi:hypothetical protein
MFISKPLQFFVIVVCLLFALDFALLFLLCSVGLSYKNIFEIQIRIPIQKVF